MKLLNGLFVALALLILVGFALGRSAPSAQANDAGCPFHAQAHAVSTADASKDDEHVHEAHGEEDHGHGHDSHGHGDGHGHGEDELHEAMEGMGDLYRQVRRSARDASKNEETADNLAQIIAYVIEAKNHNPETIAEAPEGERAELVQTYRLAMIELAQAFLSAEAAILEGRNDDAWEHLLVAHEIKGRGHELFAPEDED